MADSPAPVAAAKSAFSVNFVVKVLVALIIIMGLAELAAYFTALPQQIIMRPVNTVKSLLSGAINWKGESKAAQ